MRRSNAWGSPKVPSVAPAHPSWGGAALVGPGADVAVFGVSLMTLERILQLIVFAAVALLTAALVSKYLFGLPLMGG